MNSEKKKLREEWDFLLLCYKLLEYLALVASQKVVLVGSGRGLSDAKVS
jgi:hypothetical protein